MQWPYLTQEQILTDVSIPTDDNILVLFYPLTGGSFLPTVLSCHPSYYGKQFLEEMIEKYNTLWVLDEDHRNQWYKKLEFLNHPLFQKTHARFFNFDFYLNHKNKMIYIDYNFSKKEENFVKFRLAAHHETTSLAKVEGAYADLQMKYEKELIKYLDSKNKNYHKIPFVSFLNAKEFALEINKILDYLELSHMDVDDIERLQKAWFDCVIKYGKQKLKHKKPN
jgi:hypothetical protein